MSSLPKTSVVAVKYCRSGLWLGEPQLQAVQSPSHAFPHQASISALSRHHSIPGSNHASHAENKHQNASLELPLNLIYHHADPEQTYVASSHTWAITRCDLTGDVIARPAASRLATNREHGRTRVLRARDNDNSVASCTTHDAAG
jgi:hypothetical protein